ncbi:MAG: hypothetical protein GOMPHAMPRED_003970 [Gomphillus americanus]|uniref:DNA repair protein rad5 n=1 Tax=Gomphillus americanus TaxID=1940652 RepID=A0A8H3ITH6_9LECA|nr:MAG: hypothetical protein GOMPHAMPRED_003970 [Gomphillus americanus]
MSVADIDHRPAKKRRFFDDAPEASSPPGMVQSSIEPKHVEALEAGRSTASGFDRALFEAVVGPISEASLKKLQDAAANDTGRAINMYLDGSWQAHTEVAATKPVLPSPPLISRNSSQSSTISLSRMPDHRYVGAFGVGAWATRSGSGLIKHNELVKIERQKGKSTKLGRGGKPLPLSRQRADIIVRFTNSKGEEVGRLPKDAAAWVSSLVDTGVCHFEAVCVYTPERIRVNDTIYLQLRCFLRRQIFKGELIQPLDSNRATGIFEEKETSEEQELRLRQVSLVKLFEEINLSPVSANTLTQKHKREGILQAAEIAEQYELQKDNTKADGSTPTSDDEAEEGKELEQDQLDSLYQKAQSFDFNTPEREPVDTFILNLRKYQKQALHWMTSKELDTKASDAKGSMHPLWEEYNWPTKDVDDQDLPIVDGQDSFYVNPYSGELSLKFPTQDQHCLGGILADEMGLGKTIECLSLIHSHKSKTAQALAEAEPSLQTLHKLPKGDAVESAPCTTLVVAPMSLLAQWESEAAKASKPGTMKTLVYYGSDKAMNLQELCCEANAASAPTLIVTSYGVVLSEYNQIAKRGGDRAAHGGIFSLDFFRIILDEAHYIKNRQSKTAKACYELSAKHRWVLTGTPIVNRLEDLFSLVRFLRVEPWSNFSFWKTFITSPFESGNFIRALNVVQTVLEPLVIRRTKDMKTPDGEPLVPLPPRTIEVEELDLSKAEQEVYDYIYTRAKRTFNATVEAGTLLKSYTTIFAQILRLRQSCCHPALTRNKAIALEEEEAAAAADVANGLADDMDLQALIERFTAEESEQDANKFGAHVLKQIQDEASHECPLCFEEPMVDPAVTGCWHSACKKCLMDYVQHETDHHRLPLCFNCREPINQRDIFEIIHHDDDDGDFDYKPKGTLFFEPQSKNRAASPDSSDDLYGSSTPSPGATETPTNHPQSKSKRISLRRIGMLGSAKIAALITHLKTLRHTHPGLKSVVFSQFTSFLDLIEPALSREGITYLRFDGSMSQKTRASVLSAFTADPLLPEYDNNPTTRKASTIGQRSASSPTVLLLSLRAGGVGLNLTAAKRVFMMDPWWSFAVEAQAIDRVHRMGQDSEVKVVRFIAKSSIEGRMLKVQERKKFM